MIRTHMVTDTGLRSMNHRLLM